MRTPSLVTIGTLLLGACMLGTRAREFGPGGVDVELRTSGASSPSLTLRGELLAADASGLWVLERGAVTQITYRAMRYTKIQRFGPGLRAGQPPSSTELPRLQRLARYPRGMPPELMSSLLKGYRQTTLRVIDR